MKFTVTLDWDAKDAVPFGTQYNSKPFANKRDTWRYVQRVIERAKLAQVQLHNIYVWKNHTCVWCLKDPRKSGDPWPTWEFQAYDYLYK